MYLFGFKFRAMGGENEIQLYADDLSFAEEIVRRAIEETQRIERKYSVFLEESVTSKIRNAAGRHAIEIDEETAQLIDYAAECYYQSDGMFDITSGPLRKLWDFKKKTIPDLNKIKETKSLCGFDRIERQRRYNLYLDTPGMELDFGGIGKEYAVDRVATLLLENGVQSALINFAGDVRVIGPHLDGSAWQIGIAHPRKPGAILCTIPLYTGALATSGDYERYFEVGGKRHCHIINPRTGYPVDDLQSVTVIAQNCLAAGTLSTIGMLCGEVDAPEILDGQYFLIVKKDGSRISPKVQSPTEGDSCGDHL